MCCDMCKKPNVLYEDEPIKKVTPDEMFKSAVKLVMEKRFATMSMLQKCLSVGYSRAALIMDNMEKLGYIEPASESRTKKRKVLITPEQFRKDFGEN